MRTALCAPLVAATLLACGSPPHRLEYGSLESTSMDAEMGYSVYAPPGFTADERLPLVVFLHGGGDSPESFDAFRVGQTLDLAVAEGAAPRAVIVLPQGDLGFWANWYDGSRRYQDWVLDELLPRVASDYHTLPCPEGCHVMGVSMGGAGTLRFALDRPAMFASATIISGPILDTEQMVNFARNPLLVPILPTGRIWGPSDDRARIARDDPFLRWTRDADLGGMRLMVAWGEHDRGGIIETSEAFRDHLVESGIEHEHLVFDGNHSWVSWTPVIEEALRRQVGF